MPDATHHQVDSYCDMFILWLKSKRYSSNTIQTYSGALRVFLQYVGERSPATITSDDIIGFNHDVILKRGLSVSYQNQVVNALKLFFSNLAPSSELSIYHIHRPRKVHHLPNVLSKDEVKRILDVQTNVKHRVMLSLTYSCGLRRSELLNLKPQHIDSRRGVVIIKQSKGNKDRIVPLSHRILTMLREYYKAYKPTIWLFEGQQPGTKYSDRSLHNVLKQAVAKAGITKPVSLHWLRHSYATHLLESGTDIRYIQELLGHKSCRTTEIYTHVSTKSIQNIKSPFDEL